MHALALCLQGLTRPGGKMLAASGRPYDTLEQVIGLSGEPGMGSLRDYGIGYDEVDLTPDGKIDLPAVLAKIDDDTQLVTFQRSRGYAWRPCLSVDDIGEAARAIHAKRPDVCVMVDNCYGEFTRKIEPTDVDVDVIAGSLIKNPGGGIAPTGGYIAGRHKYVEMIAYRLTSPGIGREVGSYYASYQPFYQGLFIAPHITMQAVKTSALAARVFGKLGYDVNPAFDAPREDIIQAIRFGEADKLIAHAGERGEILPEDLDVVTPTLECTIFQLIDDLVAHNGAGAYRRLAIMHDGGEDDVRVLAMITRQMRFMAHIKLMQAKRVRDDEIIKALGINPYGLRNTRRQLGAFTEERLERAYRDCVDAEYAIKSGAMSDEEALGRLMLNWLNS